MLHKPFGYVLGVEGHPIKANDPSPLLSQEDDSLGPASRHIPPSEKFSVGCTIGKITIGKLPDREARGGGGTYSLQKSAGISGKTISEHSGEIRAKFPFVLGSG